MRIFMSACKQAPPLLNYPPARVDIDSFNHRRRKDKVVFVMGATGTGKSRLSIDLATIFPAEIVNSDKMQIYKGLDIVTNKVTEEERRGIPHHLLGVVDSDEEFTATDFGSLASLSVKNIVGRERLPIIVGGSNSCIEALAGDEFRSKYDCCFLWVDVSVPVLHSFVSERVDRMVEAGLIDEVRRIFHPDADYSRGIRRAIGVPEMDQYLRSYKNSNERIRRRMLEAAINEIKANTCKLAYCQLQKIKRLRARPQWNIHKLDATEVFQKRGVEADEAWDMLVARPANKIVRQFLSEKVDHGGATNFKARITTAAAITAAEAVLGTAYFSYLSNDR